MRLHRLNVQPKRVQRRRVPRLPYSERTFELFYEFDSEFAGITINQLRDAVEYAHAIEATAIRVIGYRASSLLSHGSYLEEIPYMAELRAKELELALKLIGLPQDARLSVEWRDDILQGNGLDDWRRRKAEIIVTP